MAFDAVQWPRVSVLLGIGAEAGPTSIVLGVGPGLGTGTLGGVTMVDINAAEDVRSIDTNWGASSEFDPSSPGTATIVASNHHGNYDQTNPASPYWGPNRLDANTSSIETDASGWQVGSNCTLARSTAQAKSGSASLSLTAVAAANMWANTPGGQAGVRVPPGVATRADAWFRANTTGRNCRVSLVWFDSAGQIFHQDDGSLVADNSSGWIQASVTVTGPLDGARVAVQVLVDSTPAAGEVHYVDLIRLQTSAIELGVPVQVLGEYPLGMLSPRFTGEIVDISLDLSGKDPTVMFTCADGLEKLGRAGLATEVAQFGGDYPGVRVGNILDRAAWSQTARLLDRGTDPLLPTVFGESALELLRKVELTEFGALFVDRGGNVVFYDRHRAYFANRSVTVQATFSTTISTSTVSVVDAGAAAKSRERVCNDARATRNADPTQDPDLTGSAPGDVPVEQAATDPTSIGPPGNYGTLSIPAQVGELHASDAAVLAMLQGIVGRFAWPTMRIREFTVDALGADRWPILLPLGRLDRIAVNCNYGPNTVAGQLLIQAGGETIQCTPSPQWTMKFTATAPPPPPALFVLDGGQLDIDRMGW